MTERPADTLPLETELEEAFPPGGAGDEAREQGAGEEGAGAGPSAQQFDMQMFRKVVEFPFTYLASRRGEHWKLTEPELDILAPAALAVAEKYLPSMDRWAPEIALGVSLVIIVGPRLSIDAKTIEDKPNRPDTGDGSPEPAAAT